MPLSGIPPIRRLGLIFILGLLAGLAFAPTFLVPLWPLGFGVALLFIYQAQTWRMRLGVSFLFSYGYMLSGLYWISLAPSAIPDFYFLIPVALIVLPAFAASFGTLALFLAGFWRKDPLSYGLIALGFWMFFEWRRGIDLTGFAWNRAGMIWAVDPATMQAAALGGVPLLSLISILAGVGVFLLFFERRGMGAGFILVPCLALVAFGLIRLGLNPQSGMETIPDLRVRLVQANIPKNSVNPNLVYDTHLDLSNSQPLDGITHVIWPEGSVRAFLDQRADLRQHLATSLNPVPFSLVFGREAVELQNEDQKLKGTGAHLSAYLIDHRKNRFATYKKMHLVPFGEYIPYKFIFKYLGFSALTGQFLDRIPGQAPQTLDLPNSPKVGVFICYDSIYSGQIVDQSNRPDWLVTLTEDAWYILPDIPVLQKTPGPYQHYAEARVRAIEEGLSIARASNPGISAVIDPFGRQWGEKLNLGDQAILDSSIPVKQSKTFYSFINISTLYLFFTFIPAFIALLFLRNARL